MLSTVYSAGLYGIDGYIVTVECNAQSRIPDFELVGLPDLAVKEAKERVRTACENSGFRQSIISCTLSYHTQSKKAILYFPWNQRFQTLRVGNSPPPDKLCFNT